jgi:hypothetical protein
MSKRFAPNLQSFIDYWIGNAMKDHRPVVQSELRALLSVANAAKAIRPFLPGWEDRCTRLFRAVDRLDRLGKEKK